nr:TonB family protein [Planctomycetota bacterium]
LGIGWALIPVAAAPERAVVPFVTVRAAETVVEPDPALDIEALPPLDVVHERTPQPTPEATPEVVLPDPVVEAPALPLDVTALRITPSMIEPRPRKAPVPAPEAVAQPAPLPPAKPTVTAPTRPVVEAQPTRLRARAVPPLLRYYPADLRSRGVEGRVMVKVTVSARGYVVDAEVLTSSGHTAFDDAALRLVRDTQFAPPGQLAYGKLPVRFRLR